MQQLQYCKKYNTACNLPSCEFGETITDIRYHADRHELTPEEMNEKEAKQYWKEGIHFFEHRNMCITITTPQKSYINPLTGKLIEDCNDFIQREVENGQ